MDLSDIMMVWNELNAEMRSPPTYVAVVHTTRTGEIEQVYLLNNKKLDVKQMLVEQTPEWLRDAVAVLRYCPVDGALETPEISGYKITDFMLAVVLTVEKYNNLRRGVQ